MIAAGLRTPAVYTEINTQTTRTGLPDNRQRVLLLSSDTTGDQVPVALYDAAQARAKFGAGSVMARMVAALVKTNALADAEGLRLGE